MSKSAFARAALLLALAVHTAACGIHHPGDETVRSPDDGGPSDVGETFPAPSPSTDDAGPTRHDRDGDGVPDDEDCAPDDFMGQRMTEPLFVDVDYDGYTVGPAKPVCAIPGQ